MMGRLPSASSLLLLLAVFVLRESSGVAGSTSHPIPLVEKTCKDAFGPDYDKCVRVLGSAPESKYATDARDLVIIAGNLTRANVSYTLDAMKELIQNLQSCIRVYEGMKYDVGIIMNWIKAGNLSEVYRELSYLGSTPDSCDIVLFESRYEIHPYRGEDSNAEDAIYFVAGIFATIYEPPPENFAVVDVLARSKADFTVDGGRDKDISRSMATGGKGTRGGKTRS